MSLTLPVIYAISHTWHCTVTVCTWSHGYRGMVIGGVPYNNLPAITIEIYNCHLQKTRQLSRNGICCMKALFLFSISACDFHLKLLIHMLFAMKLSVRFYRPWAPPYWIIFRSYAKTTETASTSLRRASQKLCALGKHFRWTFSGGVAPYVTSQNGRRPIALTQGQKETRFPL